MKALMIGAAALGLVVAGGAQAATIVNGDFSQPDTHGSWGEFASLPGWYSNTSDSLEVGASSVYGLGCVSSGCQNLEVNANAFGSVSQTLAGLTVGDTYTVSWDYGGRNAGGPQELQSYIGGTLETTENSNGVNASWSPDSFKFVAGSTGEVLTFSSVNVGGTPSYGNELTDVALAVPEPATWAMMLLGIGLIGGGLRMTRSRRAAALSAA